MSHTCSTAIIRCMDFRLGGAIRDYLDSNDLYNDVDIISIAGASKDLVEDADGFLATQIELSKSLHNIDRIILMNHTDCGGYGGRSAFESPEDEIENHVTDMKIAKSKLNEKYPDIEVELALAHIDDNNEVSITHV